MLLSLLLGLLQIAGATGDTALVEQSRNQAKYYINNISQEKNPDANLWSLTLLASENPEIRKFVEKEVKGKRYHGSALSEFSTIEKKFSVQLKKTVFETGSPNLLIALLLET